MDQSPNFHPQTRDVSRNLSITNCLPFIEMKNTTDIRVHGVHAEKFTQRQKIILSDAEYNQDNTSATNGVQHSASIFLNHIPQQTSSTRSAVAYSTG
jgi:hypothetical protein